MLRLLIPLLLAPLAACAAVPPPAEPAPAFYVMRHLHTPEGERDPDLTAEGQRHAEALAGLFGPHPPRAIYVNQWRRTAQTAAALATRLGLEPVVYDARDTDALVIRVQAEPGPVLVVGHSNTVPDIVERLGGARPAPLSHPDFADLWTIWPDGRTERSRLQPR